LKLQHTIISISWKCNKWTFNFKYHLSLREGVCSNRQSTVIWAGGVLAKSS